MELLVAFLVAGFFTHRIFDALTDDASQARQPGFLRTQLQQARQNWVGRAQQRARRKAAWIDEKGAHKDQQWLDRKRAKLNRAVQRRQKPAARRGVTWQAAKDAAGLAAEKLRERREQGLEDLAHQQNSRHDAHTRLGSTFTSQGDPHDDTGLSTEEALRRAHALDEQGVAVPASSPASSQRPNLRVVPSQEETISDDVTDSPSPLSPGPCPAGTEEHRWGYSTAGVWMCLRCGHTYGAAGPAPDLSGECPEADHHDWRGVGAAKSNLYCLTCRHCGAVRDLPSPRADDDRGRNPHLTQAANVAADPTTSDMPETEEDSTMPTPQTTNTTPDTADSGANAEITSLDGASNYTSAMQEFCTGVSARLEQLQAEIQDLGESVRAEQSRQEQAQASLDTQGMGDSTVAQQYGVASEQLSTVSSEIEGADESTASLREAITAAESAYESAHEAIESQRGLQEHIAAHGDDEVADNTAFYANR